MAAGAPLQRGTGAGGVEDGLVHPAFLGGDRPGGASAQGDGGTGHHLAPRRGRRAAPDGDDPCPDAPLRGPAGEASRRCGHRRRPGSGRGRPARNLPLRRDDRSGTFDGACGRRGLSVLLPDLHPRGPRGDAPGAPEDPSRRNGRRASGGLGLGGRGGLCPGVALASPSAPPGLVRAVGVFRALLPVGRIGRHPRGLGPF